MKILSVLLLTIFSLVPSASFAGPFEHSDISVDPAEQLGVCLTDSLTGKERKWLAQWMFFAQSRHPSLAGFATVSAEDIDETDRAVGKIITRLLTVDCASYMRAAHESSPLAMQFAFELVGRVAMAELMTSPEVLTFFGGHAKYTDMVKINELMISPRTPVDR